MKNIEKAALLEYSDLALTNEEKEEIIYNCYDGKCTYNGKVLNVKGNMPDRGRIIVNDTGATFENIIIKGYNCIKENNKFTCNNTGLTTVNGTSILIDNNKTTEIEDYKIYGNSIQNGTPTPDNSVEVESVGDLLTLDNCESYGEEACNNVGKYVIPIKVTGKNLISFPYVDSRLISSNSFSHNGITYQVNNDGSITVSGTATSDTNFLTLTGNIDFGEMIYLNNYNGTNSNDLYSANSHVVYNKINKTSSFGWFKEGDVVSGTYYPQIEYGDKSTEYEPYKEKIYNIYLEEPLRSIGEYSDYIDFKNKKVVRNIYKVKFYENLYLSEADTSWQRDGYTSWYANSFSEDSKNDSSHIYDVLSNRFQSGDWHWSHATEPYNCIGYKQSRIVYFIISNEFTSITDEDDIETKKFKIKEWIKNNETYLYFPLATEKKEDINLPTILINKDTSLVSVNTNIQSSNIELQYYR